MVITINKDTKSKDIQAALEKIQKAKENQSLSSFYGKLKGTFGDAMEYQKKLRNEWD